MRDFTKIEAWKLADDLAVAVYEFTRSFPKEALYGLTSQFRRAAVSVAANIVEGSDRATKRDSMHSLRIARGSLAEAQYYACLANKLSCLAEACAANSTAQGRQSFACLRGLIKAVETEAGIVPEAIMP